MTFRRLTILCWILLLMLPTASAIATDTLDLWVCGLTITPLGDDEYMISPTICMEVFELGTDYDYDLRIEYGTAYETEELTIDGDPTGVSDENGCIVCDADSHNTCNDRCTQYCPDVQHGWPLCLWSSSEQHCYCKWTHLVHVGPLEFPPGLITIVVRVDFGEDVPETNENNNDFTTVYTP